MSFFLVSYVFVIMTTLLIVLSFGVYVRRYYMHIDIEQARTVNLHLKDKSYRLKK